jgi:sec-independent protein translocase protein TatC
MVDTRIPEEEEEEDRLDDGEKNLTLMEHLLELRERLVKSSIAVAAGTVVSFVFAQTLFEILKRPAILNPDSRVHFIYTEPAELIGTYFKVALTTGLILAMPVVIYQAAMFIGPGLTRQEKRLFVVLLGPVTVLFLLGIAFGYFVALPPAFNFLFNFAPNIADPEIKIASYINTMTSLLFWIGVSFETPLVMFALSKVHITSASFFLRYWRYAFAGAFVLGAIITPTFDPVNQTIVALPIFVLYLLGVLLSRFA